MDPITIAMALAQFAPSVIRFLTGSDKAADVADKVVNTAMQVTGRQSGEAALEAIKADPNLVLQFRTKILESESDLEKAYLADRRDARSRDVEIIKATGSNNRANWMIFLAALGLIACLFVLVRFDMKPEITTIVSTIASIFGLCLRDAFQFEFGSSRGSQEKNDALFKNVMPK